MQTWDLDMSFCLTPGPPSIGAWQSVREHPDVGPLPIELDASATGSAVVAETRRYGIQQIEVDFSEPVQLVGGAALQAVDANSGTPYPVDASSFTNGNKTLVMYWNAGVLPDQVCYRIDLAGAIENMVGVPLGGDTDCMVRALVGDTNNDQFTNLTDMAQVKSKDGQDPSPDGKAKFDVNVDGSINLTDMALVKSLDGRGASCP